MLDLRARRGAMIVLVGVMIIGLMAITALSIDLSRLWTLRNELQLSADAGAHAGAIQLFPPRVAANAPDSARAYAERNLAMQDTVTVDSLELGDWNDSLRVFTPGAATTDAINVVVSRQATGLIMSILGVPLPTLKARAVGWAEAPVATDGCIRPWAVPYVTLMYRINLYRGITPANSWANLTRPFDQVNDIAALQAMTVAERTFNLKLGSGTLQDSVTQAMPGNYQAIQLPKLWDKATQTYPTPGPVSGANAYRENVSGGTCHGLSVGDSVMTQNGNMAGPSIQGAVGQAPATGPGVCDTLKGETDNTNVNNPAFGDCLDSGGNPPDVKAAFYLCTSGCQGQSTAQVTMLGSFTMLKIYPKSSNSLGFDQAEIVGVFNPIQSGGPVGGGSTTLMKPIIAR